MPRHNWNAIIENLKNHPGEEILVAEHVRTNASAQRLRDAGIEIRKERVTGKLYNLYATCPLPEPSALNFDAVTAATKRPDPDAFLKKAKRLAMNAYNTDAARSMYPEITMDEVYVVWFCKTLQHWKALVSTSVPLDSTYFEITYNGDKGEAYVDTYFKHAHTAVPDTA